MHPHQPATDPDVDTSRISPTAHYTGYVWYRHGLSPQALATVPGAVLFHSARPLAFAASLTMGGVSLEDMLLARHRAIDEALAGAILAGRVGQVVEIAGGLSGRGHRFVREHADRKLVYVEGDLPRMAQRKRAALEAAGARAPRHHVLPMNVLLDDGPESLAEATAPLLRPDRGVAIITEGLLNYFDLATIATMWTRFVRWMRPFEHGLYLSDLSLDEPTMRHPTVRAFRRLLRGFARGATHLHFESEDDAVQAGRQAGFRQFGVLRPPPFAAVQATQATRIAPSDSVTVLEAWV